MPATRPRPRVGSIVLAACGVVLLGIPVWALATAFDAIVTGHPVYPVMLTISAVAGGLLLLRTLRRSNSRNAGAAGQGASRPVSDSAASHGTGHSAASRLPDEDAVSLFGDRSAAAPGDSGSSTHEPSTAGAASRRRKALRASGWVAAVLTTAVVAVVLVFGRPHSATDIALAAMSGTDTVSVTHDTTSITLTPRKNTGVGVVFQPGARVDARAYVPILTRLAERGHTVVIAEQPLGVSLLAQGAAVWAMDAHPEVSRWVAAGHSLGGVAAARTAASSDPRVVGLLFWASYADVRTPTDVVPVLSVYGTNDGLIAPAEAVPAPEQRPANTRYVAAEGATHTSFSDYGTQSDDGVESVPHDVAQQRITEPTLAFLDELSR
ncbi:alpha/beta hydrolase [Mobilicoccus caccae]|uniref:alpha/beta hydrolase n=1 Tax=Mobilicoccus caccae TaxID=1859295 RepID=UPI0024E0CC06|nr:alpha/beta hydrolase [Mobilicoccus caccae]